MDFMVTIQEWLVPIAGVIGGVLFIAGVIVGKTKSTKDDEVYNKVKEALKRLGVDVPTLDK